MKPEVDEDDELDELDELPPPPRPPVTDGVELPPDPLELVEEDEPLEPAVTLSPTAPLTAAIVPDSGAMILVAATSFSAFVTFSCALVTAA
jgi:hypothetical protein